MQHDLDARRLHCRERRHANDSWLPHLAPTTGPGRYRIRRRRRAGDRERRHRRRHEYAYVARRNGQPHRPLPPGPARVLHTERQTATAVSKGAVAAGDGGGTDTVTASSARAGRRGQRPLELVDHAYERFPEIAPERCWACADCRLLPARAVSDPENIPRLLCKPFLNTPLNDAELDRLSDFLRRCK